MNDERHGIMISSVIRAAPTRTHIYNLENFNYKCPIKILKSRNLQTILKLDYKNVFLLKIFLKWKLETCKAFKNKFIFYDSYFIKNKVN